MAYIPSETHFCFPSEEFETIVIDYVVLDRTSIGFNRVLVICARCSLSLRFNYQGL